MSRLSPDLVLKRLPDIEVRINSDNNIQVDADDTVYYIGQHGLAVLDAFYQPVRVSQALERLRACVRRSPASRIGWP